MVIFYTIILILFTPWISAAENLKIILVAELLQPEAVGWFSDALRDLLAKSPGLLVEKEVVLINREDEDESHTKLCALLGEGASAVLDLAWAPWGPGGAGAGAGARLPAVHAQVGEGGAALDALLQLLDKRDASDAVLIFHSRTALEQTLYRMLGRSVLRVLTVSDLEKNIEMIKDMRPMPGHFVIFGPTDFVQDSYKLAAASGLVQQADRWVLVMTDHLAHHLDVSVLQNPTMVLAQDHKTACRLLKLPESCSDEEFGSTQIGELILSQILSLMVRTGFDLPRVSYDCDTDSTALSSAPNIFYDKLAKETDAKDSLLYFDKERKGLYLKADFTLLVGGKEGLTETAKWKGGEPLKLLPNAEIKTPRRFFRIGTTTSIPWTYPKIDPMTGKPMFLPNGSPVYEGYCIDLIVRLAELMDIDYEIVTPKIDGFGKRLPNKTWTGLVGDLARGDTDIAVAAMVMTSEREEVVDFVAPYFEETGLSIVIRRPLRKTSLFKFMTVLRIEVWLSILAALVATAMLLALLDKYSPYSARNNKNAYPYPCRLFTLRESFWFTLTSFTPQGGGEAPKALSARCLVAAYWLFVVLMLATFTANLAAFLTVERMQSPISSLEQLARQSRINYTVAEGTPAHLYFINMKNAEDILYRVWKELTLNSSGDQHQFQVWDYPVREMYGHILLAINSSIPVHNAEEGFLKVDEHEEGDFAFIEDSSRIKYEVTKNCNLSEVGEMFGERPLALALQQGSRLQDELTQTLLKMQKDRFLVDLRARYWNNTCPETEESEGIDLDSLGGVFIATLFGLAVAMVTLLWEIIYYKRKEKLNKKISVKNIEGEEIESWGAKEKKTNLVKRVTIGDSFKPVKNKVSVINVEPRNAWNP